MIDHTEATSPLRQIAPLAIILGIPLLFAALFFYTTPVVLETGGQQGIFKCGSPSSPNSEAENVCQESETIARNKAIYSGLSGVALVGLGAVWMVRGQRREDEWDDEDAPRRRRSDDIDLRADTRERDRGDRGRDDSLRGVERDELRGVDRDVDDRGFDARHDDEIEDSRAARRRSGGRRSMLRDDDFADRGSRRGDEDDWSSDGWR